MRMSQVSVQEEPCWESFWRPEKKTTLKRNYQVYFSDFWDLHGCVRCFLDYETFESSHSLPSSRVTKRSPSSSVARHGHPLFPSLLHLHQDLQLSWQTPCEEQPGVFHHPDWLLWLKPPGELFRSLQFAKYGHKAAVCRCGTLLPWPSMLEIALDPPCWFTLFSLPRRWTVTPWHYLVLPYLPTKEKTPGQSYTKLNRRIRTLVCEGLDMRQPMLTTITRKMARLFRMFCWVLGIWESVMQPFAEFFPFVTWFSQC